MNGNTDILLLTAVDPFSYQIIPDLGLMYLAGSARQAGLDVTIKDCRKEGLTLAGLEELARSARPLVAGIKSYSNESARVARMAAAIRRAHPEAVIVVGGPHPSMSPLATMASMPEVDYAFLGEAERNFVLFCRWVKDGRSGPMPPEVRGIAFRTEGKVEIRPACFDLDLDRLPFPAWDLMRPDTYPDEAAGVFVPAFPAAPMMLSRGCPYRCSYCGGRLIMGGRLRYRSVENILAEIDLLERDYGVRTFTFVDDNFTSDRERATDLFAALSRRSKRIAFTFPNGVRLDSLDEELLKLMESAGCYSLALGIESGSDQVLGLMKKKQTVAQVREKVGLIRRTTGIRVTGFFILGYPGESLAEVRATISFAAGLPLHHAHFCLLIPLPGTPIGEELAAKGLIRFEDLDPESLTIDRTDHSLPGLPAASLLRLHRWAYLRFYLTPWRALNLLRQLKSASHFRVILRRFLKLFR